MKNIFFLFIALFAMTASTNAQPKISYEISFTEPQAHYIEVKMTLSGIVKDHIDVKMPVWQPGSYLIREFAKNVERFNASNDGKSVRTQKISKNTWRIFSAKAQRIQINYRIYAFERSVRTSFVDQAHAFLSNTGVFMYPDGMLNTPSIVKIIPHQAWHKVTTGLEKIAGDFTYSAPNFDVLFDSPIEIGNQDVFEFTAAGVRHEVAMVGRGNYNKEKLQVDMAKVVAAQSSIFGENPNKHYAFIVHNGETWSGGLEHLNSTTLGVIRDTYGNTAGYNRFIALVAHEYFHLWNVKRMRPVALGPFDYENENYTTNLWIAEGFTTYFASKTLLRIGFSTPEGYVSGAANGIATTENLIGAKEQSAAAASFDTWIVQYRPNEQTPNNSVSYYTKGNAIAVLMDLAIAHATKGVKNLDDVMKAMYLQGKQLKRGYTDAEFKAMVEKVSGINFTEFWDRYINGTAAIDYEKYFNYAGVIVKDQNAGKRTTWLGATVKNNCGKMVVANVARGSGAWIDGINVNDEIVSIDGVLASEDLEKMVDARREGDVVKVAIIRDGIKGELNITLTSKSTMKLVTSLDPSATPQQKAVLKGWLRQ